MRTVRRARSSTRATSAPSANAYDKIKRLLEKHGATLADVAKMVSYLTDVRYQPDYGKCRVEAFGNNPLPAHTLLTISQLAWPGMIVEIDVTAVVSK
jgi:enamine deaminase RidA (YjgF/YER057c/UK114 family)